MQNKSLDLFKKGNYKEIDTSFVTEGIDVLQSVSDVQVKYGKTDTDTFINELRDCIAGQMLGFTHVNTEKHGFDCRKTETGEDIFLEVKSASFSASEWGATFNDTTLEKAEAFKDKKTFLALSVWKEASQLLFICYGQNEAIGEFLEEKVKWFKAGHTVRSTQSISLSTLVFTYGFKILAVNKTKDQIYQLLISKNRQFTKLNKDEQILDLHEFEEISR